APLLTLQRRAQRNALGGAGGVDELASDAQIAGLHPAGEGHPLVEREGEQLRRAIPGTGDGLVEPARGRRRRGGRSRRGGGSRDGSDDGSHGCLPWTLESARPAVSRVYLLERQSAACLHSAPGACSAG